MGGVPDRWLDYTTVGKPIPRTRIICFKVPLKKEISKALPVDKRFTPDMLLKALPNLVGVIDVTNTPRYYDNQELIRNGVRHEKIRCPGHVIPPPNVVHRFQGVMDNLWNVADSLGKYVGVHCTHGVNRTGYLVCRYLIERHGFHPEEAIKLFAESRGHPIERKNYLDSLMALSVNASSRGTYNALRQPQTGYPPKREHPQHEPQRQRNFSGEQGQYRNQTWQRQSNSYRNNSRNYIYSRNQQSSSQAYHSSKGLKGHNPYYSDAPLPRGYNDPSKSFQRAPRDAYHLGTSPAYDHSYPSISSQRSPLDYLYHDKESTHPNPSNLTNQSSYPHHRQQGYQSRYQ